MWFKAGSSDLTRKQLINMEANWIVICLLPENSNELNNKKAVDTFCLHLLFDPIKNVCFTWSLSAVYRSKKVVLS